jgi:hypothetical protein
MEYSIEVQRNYSSKNAISVEYLGSNVKGLLAKMKILFLYAMAIVRGPIFAL